MITKGQHKKLCQLLSGVKLNNVPVTTYTGQKVVRVDVDAGEIFIEGREKITWRSYRERTTLKEAYQKFVIPAFTLDDYRKMK